MKAPFLWGQGGRKMTPDQVDRERLVAQALMAQASDTSPVGHWTAALNRALQGVTGGIRQRRAGRAEDEGLAAAAERVAPYLGGSPTVTASSMGGSPVATALAGGEPNFSPAPAPDPLAPSMGTEGAIYPNEVTPGGLSMGVETHAAPTGGTVDAIFKAELMAGGLSEAQADGILMNAHDESGFNPSIVGDNGNAFGLLQWNGPRKRALEQFAAQVGGSPADPRIQAQFTLYELNGPESAAGRALAAATTPGEAAAIFLNQFERPAEVHRARREAKYLGGGGVTSGGGNITASTMGGSPVASVLMSGPSSQELLGLLADPWVARQYGPVLQALAGNASSREQAIFAQQLAQSDPMYQAQLAQLTAPAASPTAEREAFALAGGLQPGSPEWAHYMLTGQMPGGGEGFTLGEGQIRFGPNGEVIAKGPASSPDQPTSVQEYLFYQEQAAQAGQQPMSYSDWDMARKAAGASRTSVDVSTGGGKFEEAFAKGDAETIGTVYDAGLAATRNLGRIDQLEALLQEAPSGMGGRLAQIAGEWGLAVDGTDAVQAAQAMINSLVPEQRPAGSGPMSDADLELFKQSLPRIINTPGGNQMIVDTMRAIAQYDAQGAEIVQRMRLPEGDPNRLTRAEAFQMLQQRQNPLATFKGQAGAPAAVGAALAPAGDKPRKRYNPATGAFE